MRRDGEPDGDGGAVDSALDELYVTPPPAFVSRRESLATEAKAAGRVADARRIRAARRPSLAAWAANLLLRSRPEESRAFLDLGQALRDAYRSLDADGVKELSEQRRGVVAALSRQAAELAAEAGHRLSDPVLREVEATLRAVLADEDAAGRWATGRLESALTPPSDFPGTTAVRTDRPRRPTAPTRTSTSTQDEVAERRRQRQERLAQQKQEKLARQKQEKLARQEQEKLARRQREKLAQEKRERLGRAREEARAADQRLRQARDDLRRAERQQRAAEKQREEAAGAVSRAEREARDAASEVKRLSGRGT
ncbi:hypothetical protein [Streptomyces deccanensis]|uniref:hypothetical protein n=1 Tax=Streptomyces deccanensis TaxID=424188 RepID=UPI001EFB0DE8|nr:hypothetical protein [Streptomyces deccanensis]ULR48146.1 hypothetical protein L3078_01975 [Streptomyces deccanensis]